MKALNQKPQSKARPPRTEKIKIKLSKEQVRHIAELARLDLTENEIEKFQEQLSSVLDYISLLDKVDTKRVEPLARATGSASVMRTDSVDKERCLSQRESLGNAPGRKNGFFKVKPIFVQG